MRCFASPPAAEENAVAGAGRSRLYSVRVRLRRAGGIAGPGGSAIARGPHSFQFFDAHAAQMLQSRCAAYTMTACWTAEGTDRILEHAVIRHDSTCCMGLVLNPLCTLTCLCTEMITVRNLAVLDDLSYRDACKAALGA